MCKLVYFLSYLEFTLSNMIYGFSGFSRLIISMTYPLVRVTVLGKGALHISHSNLEKLIDRTMSLNSFLILLLIQFFRQETCTN